MAEFTYGELFKCLRQGDTLFSVADPPAIESAHKGARFDQFVQLLGPRDVGRRVMENLVNMHALEPSLETARLAAVIGGESDKIVGQGLSPFFLKDYIEGVRIARAGLLGLDDLFISDVYI